MNITLLKSEIADLVLARAALCGDLTGRGSVQGDRDRAAIEYLLDRFVPATLADLGIGYTATAAGWQLSDIDYPGPLDYYLAQLLLHSLRPDAYPAPDPPSDTFTVPRLTAEY